MALFMVAKVFKECIGCMRLSVSKDCVCKMQLLYESAHSTSSKSFCRDIAPDKRCIHVTFILFLHKSICCGYSFEAPH